VANLNDADADAFFRQGDEGTYTGGPGDSIPTGVVNVFDDLDAEALPRLTREQIERRDRNKRWVTGLVAALGVSALLAAAVRVAGTGTDDVSKLDSAAAAVEVTAPPPAMPPAPAVAPEPIAAAPMVAAPTPEVAAPPAALAEPAAAPPPAKPAQPVRETTLRAKASSADREAARAPHASKAIVAPAPPAMPKAAPSPVHSSPPTANFPD
jgi:hypothetical protein